MNSTTKIETTDLPQTTFGDAVVGSWYVTTRGHRVQAVEVEAGSHAIVESRSGKQVRVAGDQVAFGPVAEAPGEPAPAEPSPETGTRGAKARQATARDPRLPEPGTPIRKEWRSGGERHVVVATEQPDGSFLVEVDGEAYGSSRSLSAAAATALSTQGITSSVNGFAWFRVRQPEAAPRGPRPKSVDRLQAEVERASARFLRAAEIAARYERELEAATEALAAAEADQAAA